MKKLDVNSREYANLKQQRDSFDLTSDEMTYFQPQKLQYFGNVQNSAIQEVGFHKFSLVPLLPQVVDGTNWEKHLERMLVEDVDYALFDSGNKLEKTRYNDKFYTDNRSVSTIENHLDDYSKEKPSYSVQTGFLCNLKEQLKMSPELHDDLIFGTQFRKLLFPNFVS